MMFVTKHSPFPNMDIPSIQKHQSGQLWQSISVSDPRIDLPHALWRRHETSSEWFFAHNLKECLCNVIPLLHEMRGAKKWLAAKGVWHEDQMRLPRRCSWSCPRKMCYFSSSTLAQVAWQRLRPRTNSVDLGWCAILEPIAYCSYIQLVA